MTVAELTETELLRVFDDITRRELVIGGAALAGLIAAGCSSDASNPSAEGSTVPGSTKDPGEGASVEPSYLVVLDPYTAIACIALGRAPDALYTSDGSSTLVRQLAAAAGHEFDDAGQPFEPNVEQIAALGPDLILVSSVLDEAQVAALAKVARTASVGATGDWRAYTTELGELLGRQEAARRLIGSTEARIADVRRRLSAADPSSELAVIGQSFNPGLLATYGAASSMSEVLAELGITRPESERVPDEFLEVSLEQLAAHDAERMVLLDTADLADAYADLEASPVYRQLFAVQGGRVDHVDLVLWASGSAASARWIADDIAAIYLGDGEVATIDDASRRLGSYASEG